MAMGTMVSTRVSTMMVMDQPGARRALGLADYAPLIDELARRLERTFDRRLVSVVIYGSVARGTARPESDLDVLVVADDLPESYYERLDRVLPIVMELRATPAWQQLVARGITPFPSLLVLSRAEARKPRLLYLDMLDEARLVIDRQGFFAAQLEALRRRLSELGARKVRRDGAWYWDLKPDLRLGEALWL